MSATITASSGLQAAQRQLEAAASAVARWPLADAGGERGAPAEAPTGGVSTALRDGAPPDLVAARTEALTATYAFAANAKVLRAQEALLGTLLDVRA